MFVSSSFNQELKALYTRNIMKYPSRHGPNVIHDQAEEYESLMRSLDFMIATLINICALFPEMHDTFRAQLLSPETMLGQVLRVIATVMADIRMNEGDHYYCLFHSQDQEDPVRHVGPCFGPGTLIVFRLLGVSPFDADGEQWNKVCTCV